MPPDRLRQAIREIRTATQHPFGIDFIPRFATAEHIDVCAAEKVAVVVFFWDEPSPEWLSRLRDAGCRIWVQVGSVEEGEAALRAGADALIAQGAEAGGHNRAVAATFSLLPALIDAAGAIPVIAAGGIADGRGLAAALALGAEAAWIGTRFLASTEAFAHAEYKRRILAAKVDETARHLIFGPEFPDASARGLRNRLVREWEGRDDPPPYKLTASDDLPIIGQATIFGQSFPTRRFTGIPPTPEVSGDFEEMSLPAGESVGLIKTLKSAAEIVRELTEDAEAIICNRLVGMTEATR
jgi:enoyl-[acyl-carrier protein] reductase II